MNAFKTSITLCALVLTFLACKNTTTPDVKTVETAKTTTAETVELDPNASYAKVEFGIDGMTCAMGCAKTIEKKMAKMEGVKMAKVDFENRLAMVEYDEAKVTPNSLKETVAKVSEIYTVNNIKKVDNFSKATQ